MYSNIFHFIPSYYLVVDEPNVTFEGKHSLVVTFFLNIPEQIIKLKALHHMYV